MWWAGDVTWYGVDSGPDLSPSSRSLCFHLRGASVQDADLYVMINAYWERLTFKIQAQGNWRRIVDTSLQSPNDIVDEATVPLLGGNSYDVAGRSIAVLVSNKPS